MSVSAIQACDSDLKRNIFIKYANSFMSNPGDNLLAGVEKTKNTDSEEESLNKAKGIETLTTYSIFPKQVVNGHTIITA